MLMSERQRDEGMDNINRYARFALQFSKNSTNEGFSSRALWNHYKLLNIYEKGIKTSPQDTVTYINFMFPNYAIVKQFFFSVF